MKKLIIAAALALVLVATLAPTMAFAGNGNGAPNGFHETINIIGVNNEKNANYDGGNGSVIFVKRTGTTQFLVEGANNFAILDHDGTDGKVGWGYNPELGDYVPGLTFPYNATASPTWRVQIWIRLLGPVGSSARFTSYYWDSVGDVYVLWDQFTLSKDGGTKFTEKTSELLADGYQNMLWELDAKTKFRIAQMRIFLLDD